MESGHEGKKISPIMGCKKRFGGCRQHTPLGQTLFSARGIFFQRRIIAAADLHALPAQNTHGGIHNVGNVGGTGNGVNRAYGFTSATAGAKFLVY
jgi:hypothetical protein